MQWSYPELRRRMIQAELWPEGRLARLTCYLAGMAAGLFALQKLLGLFAPTWGDHLGGWIGFLTFLAAVFFSILAFRWLKRRVLWRLRNRLIVTYVFIGVIPVVLLVAMAGFSLFLFAGQFASYVVISELNTQLRSVEAANAAIGNELAAGLARGKHSHGRVAIRPEKARPRLGTPASAGLAGNKPLPLSSEAPQHPRFLIPPFSIRKTTSYANALLQGKPFREIVSDHGKLYLRVVSVVPLERIR